jgi:hypothetical protein
MKITQERLKQIILQELDQANQGEQSEQDELANTKQKLREKFKILYTNILKVKGLSKSEIVVFNELLDTALQSMQQAEVTPQLKRALEKLQR